MSNPMRLVWSVYAWMGFAVCFYMVSWSSTPGRYEMEWANGNRGWSDGGIRGILTFSTIGCLVLAGLGYVSLTRALEEIPQLRSITVLQFVLNWERSSKYVDFLAAMGVVAALFGQIAQRGELTMAGTTAFATAVLGRSSMLASKGMRSESQHLRTTGQETAEIENKTVMNIRPQSIQIFDYDAADVTLNTTSPTSKSVHLEKYRAAGMLQPDETVESLASRYNVDTETVVQVLESGLEALQQMLQQGLASRETAKKAFRPAFHRLLHRTSIIESAVSELSILETELRRQFPRGSVIFGFYSLYPEEVESYLARLSSAGDSSRERIERILKSMYQRLSENSFGPSEIEFARDAVKPYVDRIVTALNPLS